MDQQPPAYSAPPPQAAVAVQQPAVMTVQTARTAVAAPSQPPSGNWNAIKVTGIIQIVLGALTIILGIVAVSIGTYLADVGSSIWCGLLFYLVAGILGVVAGQKQNVCAAVGYMVMSIFACLAACVVVGFAASGIPRDFNNCGGYYAHYFFCNSPGYVAVDAMLVILGIAEFVVCIVGSSLTCGPVCCSSPSHTVIHYRPQPQVVVTGQPQTVFYPSAAPQQQFVYPAQQVVGPPQGQFQPPPQGYQYPSHSQAQPQAPPLPPVDEHKYQPVTQ